MGRGLPLGPMVTTVLAVAAANVLLAYGLAHAIGGGRALELEMAALGALALVAIGCAGAAVLGWRAYLRSRLSRVASRVTRDWE